MIGRSIGTAIVGLLFGAFVGLDLVLFGVVSLDSPIMVVLAVALAVLGAALGAMAGRRRTAAARPAMATTPVTTQQGTWAPSAPAAPTTPPQSGWAAAPAPQPAPSPPMVPPPPAQFPPPSGQ